jgi:lantibiotic modifying enzyme
LQAGELTWLAGPLAKGVAFCHGTAGNAHALLHLFARTGDERWLARARAFAMHGIVQVEQERTVHGQGRHTLWTGDLGMACVLWDCISGRPGFPTLDHL